MKRDNFRNRYLIKVGSSIVIAIFNMVIQLMLPRALNIEEYGFYTYNLNVFTSIVVMANLGTSNALISKFSKRNEEIGIVYFYLKVYAAMAIILNVVIYILCCTELLKSTFTGQTLGVVLFGLEAAIINKLLTDCISLFDASAVSRFPAILQIVLKIMVTAAVFGSFIFGRLNLFSFYLLQCTITIFVVIVMIFAIIRDQRLRHVQKKDKGFKEYAKEYYIFCRPLFFSTVVSQLVIIIINWVLMNWAGAREQAMFGAAWQLNTLVSYVFSPYAELLKREFAIACDHVKELNKIYKKSLKLILWVTSYFSMFIGACASWILPIVYGHQYSKAATATLIVMFYTVYQGWGQINGSFMIATEKTKMNAIMSITNQVLMLLFTLLFQIPNVLFPNGLASEGTAYTYMISSFITVSISTLWIAEILHIRKKELWCTHIAPIIFCGSISYLLFKLLDCFVRNEVMLIYSIKIIIAGILYTLIIGAVLLFKPEFIGITGNDIKGIFRRKKDDNI